MEEMFLPDGQPVAVTRMEWDLLDNDRWRWTAWSGERRLCSVVVPFAGIDRMLRATGLFAKGMIASSRTAPRNYFPA